MSVRLGNRHTSESRPLLSGVEVKRQGHVEPFLNICPTLSSTSVGWTGLAVEDYSTPACVIPRHEHLENFLHVVLSGSVEYEVVTGGKARDFRAGSGTVFILPQGTIDELRWKGPIHRIAAAIHPSLLRNALDDTAHERNIELTEHWNLMDRNIMAVLQAMRADLDTGSPTGRLYGESLANALAVYMLNRYAVRQYRPIAYQGGLPGYRLKRVLDYIGDNLAEDIGLAALAGIAGMSAHYFAEMFKRSTGYPPHRYVLLQRIERAKQALLESNLGVIDVGLNVGFQNPSHFARVFRKFVGTSPSRFRLEMRATSRRCGVRPGSH